MTFFFIWDGFSNMSRQPETGFLKHHKTKRQKTNHLLNLLCWDFQGLKKTMDSGQPTGVVGRFPSLVVTWWVATFLKHWMNLRRSAWQRTLVSPRVFMSLWGGDPIKTERLANVELIKIASVIETL